MREDETSESDGGDPSVVSESPVARWSFILTLWVEDAGNERHWRGCVETRTRQRTYFRTMSQLTDYLVSVTDWRDSAGLTAETRIQLKELSMPVAVSYPGVYVEEIPSGVRTITGVATSITAFIGKTLRGPTTDPITITSFGDFERIFGGLHRDFTLSYAVRDFFLNGGSQAIIVRLYKPVANKATRALIEVPNLTLEAASEGAWGMQLRARVDKKPATDPNLIAVSQRLGVAPADLFDLTIRDGGTRVIESFLNLTTRESSRRADRVLQTESSLARIAASLVLPSNTSPSAHGGALTDADVWTANTKSTPAKTAAASDEAVDSAALDLAAYNGSEISKTGMFMLEKADLFNLLCILPDARGGDVPDGAYQQGLSYCATATSGVDRRPQGGMEHRGIGYIGSRWYGLERRCRSQLGHLFPAHQTG